MGDYSDSLRKACSLLEDDNFQRARAKIQPTYSNKLRESCRKNFEKLSLKLEDQNLTHLVTAKRHQKFVFAKLELQKLKNRHKNISENEPIKQNKLNMEEVESLDFSVIKINTSNNNKKLKSILKSGQERKKQTVKFTPEPLFWDCALEGDLESLKKISLTVKNLDEPNFSGVTALHNAASSGSMECVNFLIKFGCDPNVIDESGWTPLHYAAYYSSTEMCRLFIENGANLFLKTHDKFLTPLGVCKDINGNRSCEKLLAESEKQIGKINDGKVYTSFDFNKRFQDELSFKRGEMLIITKRGSSKEKEWWLAKNEAGYTGLVPFNYLSCYPFRIKLGRHRNSFPNYVKKN